MRVGIVGHEEAKFTLAGEADARRIIRALLERPNVTAVVSGHCHLGGVDMWAEEIAEKLGVPKIIFPPKFLSWRDGYMPRNKLIAEHSDQLACIAVVRLANDYEGMRFPLCYHCGSSDHIKGGGCWTMKYAESLNRPTKLYRVRNEE